MAKGKPTKNKPTGKAVRDMKGDVATEEQAVPANQFQVHQGNTSVLTVKLLDEINGSLRRIEKLLEA